MDGGGLVGKDAKMGVAKTANLRFSSEWREVRGKNGEVGINRCSVIKVSIPSEA